MPGPPPKHPSERRRRNLPPPLTQLPAEGRKGDAPEWPLTAGTQAERRVWAELWATPQAVMWERLGWTRTVARYCRFLVRAEKKDAATGLLAEVRQLEDRLGLTSMAMKRLQWEIVADEMAELRDEKDSDDAAASNVRRLKVVDPAASG